MSIYAPYDENGDYSWSVGVPASGNHILPYGLALASEPLSLEVGQSADLFEGGVREVPEGCELSYSYAATPISVDAGQVTGKKAGTSEVTAVLTLDGLELARATRTVEVTEATAEAPEVEKPTESIQPEPSVEESPDTPIINETFSLTDEASPALLLSSPNVRQLSLTSVLTTGVSFEQQVSSGQTLKFSITSEDAQTKTGTVEVSKSSNPDSVPSGAVVIPSTVENNGFVYTVTSVAAQGFYAASFVTSIAFEANSQVKTIGDEAFLGIRLLRDVRFPESVETVGRRLFLNCVLLESVVLPDSVVSMGDGVFSNCSLLQDVTLGSGISQLKKRTFYNCPQFKTIVVRGEIASFEASAIENCAADLTVHVPSQGQKEAWGSANESFGYGIDPKNIVVGTDFCTVTFDQGDSFGGALQRVVAKAEAMDEPSVPEHAGYGVEGWYKDTAFTDRWDFSMAVTGDMTLYAKWVSDVVDGNFTYRMRSDGASLAVGVVDKGAVEASVAIPETHAFGSSEYPVVEIESYAFRRANVETLTLPATIKVIGAGSFSWCASLTTVNIPLDSVLEEIQSDAFTECSALASFWAPRTLKMLGRGAFYNTSSLTSCEIEAGSQVSAIEESVFMQSGLTSFVVPEAVRSINSDSFKACKSLVSVDAPSSLIWIGDEAFRSCEVLKQFAIPSLVENVGTSSFKGCTALTSVSLPAKLGTLGATAFDGCTSLTTILAQSSLTNAGVAAAFDSSAKGSAFVVLPETSQDGSGDDFQTMKGVWKNYGFAEAHIIQSSGALPIFQDADHPSVANNDPTLASWSLSEDGTLVVRSKDGVAVGDFGWTYSNTKKNTEYWGPVRALVKAVDTTGLSGAPSFCCWFREMPQLTDITRFVVPENLGQPYVTTNVSDCFTATGVGVIPEGFSIPEGVTTVSALFNSTKITAIPDAFVLPQSVRDCSGLFNSCPIREIPDGFARQLAAHPAIENMYVMFYACASLERISPEFRLPANVTKVREMFRGCSSLVSLPDGFAITSQVDDMVGMFWSCTSLASLPERFSIPANVTRAEKAFYECPSLVSLPAGFDMTQAVADYDKVSMFGCEGDANVPLYYPGKSSVVQNYDWSSNHRTLVLPKDHVGDKAVTLNVKVDGESGEGSYWTTAYTDASGILAEPAYTPSRPGMVFTLWYADPDCTQRVDFSKAFETDATIYGKLAPGSLGGELPTVADTGSAFWSLADDGTLYIRGNGTINMKLPDTDGVEAVIAWESHRGEVKKISMAPSVDSLAMHNWFRGMSCLEDYTEAFIPKSVYSMHRAFEGCSSLSILPEGFSIPDNVENLASAFRRCSALVSLPSSFVFSESSKIGNVSNMFYDCTSLTSLPEGFVFPDRITAFNNPFYNCPSLTSLPDGFKIPDAAMETSMFSCPLVDGRFVPMYYAGNDPNVLNYDWASQNRVLISEPADRNKFTVTFKMANDDGTWAVRTKTLTNDAGLAPDLGTISREGYGFTGWCADEECTESFDFSKPLDSDREIYGKWIKYGGRDTAIGEGQLPVRPGSGEAWWQITSDGTLMILGDGHIVSFGWAWDGVEQNNTHWYPHRDSVKRITMSDTLSADNMNSWFQKMDNLTDIEGVRIPANVRSISCLFFSCHSLSVIPDDFSERIPDTVTSMQSTFNSCFALNSIPDSFKVPASVTTVYCLFLATGIRSVPEALGTSIATSKNLNDVGRMFGGCSKLESLPSTFSLPDRTVYVAGLFNACSSLRSLPEGFTVPQGVNLNEVGGLKGMDNMFAGCDNLTYLPASFDFPSTIADVSHDPFMSTQDGLKTYFAGGPDSPSSVNKYDWTSQKRELVTAVPDDKVKVSLYLSDEGTGTFGDSPWLVRLATKGATLSEPVAPAREGACFLGWYTGADCKTKFDFGATLSADTAIYGKYLTASGPLPTVADPSNGDPSIAGWSLSSDGTLSISCAAGETIKDLGWAWEGFVSDSQQGSPNAAAYESHWGPLRDRVTRVVADKTLQAQSMACWFADMVSLKSADVRIPEGVGSVDGLFRKCSSLAMVSDGFTMPDSVTSADHMFQECSSLKELPASFAMSSSLRSAYAMFSAGGFESLPSGLTLPSTLENARGLVSNCVSLTYLPSGFILKESVQDATSMFYGCTALRELPQGFRLPESISNMHFMFAFCESLTSLPTGFTIPENIATTSFEGVFTRCYALRALPEGFSLPSKTTNVYDMFYNCPSLAYIPASLVQDRNKFVRGSNRMFLVNPDSFPDAVPVVTYYAGNAADVYADSVWTNDYHRTLVASDSVVPDGSAKVVFNLTRPGDAAPTSFMTLVVGKGEHLEAPDVPSLFGYAFSGWKTEEGTAFDFANDVVAGDMTLYGSYTMITEYEVPLKAKVSVDATGNVTPAVVQMRSFTPAPLKVSSIWCNFEKSATDVLDQATLDRTAVTVAMPLGANPQLLNDDSGVMPGKATLPAATSSASPGILEYSLGMSLPDDALVKFWGDGWTTPVAKLTYTVGPVS